MMNVLLLDPQSLHPHPKVKHLVGRWDKKSPEATALRRSIQERGIIVPLIVTPDKQVMDGVTRWEAAKVLQLEAVPCLQRPESEALEICIESELHRRHGTKSQLAFRFAPLIAEAFVSRQGAQNGNLKRGAIPAAGSANQPYQARRVEDYAEELGVSVRLLEQANELHTLFARFEVNKWDWDEKKLEGIGREAGEELTFREYFSAHILHDADAMSLGGALAGLKQKLAQEGYALDGKKHRGGKPQEPSEQLRLFNDTFRALETRYEYWTGFSAEQRQEAVLRAGQAVQKAPTEFLTALATRIRRELKERKKKA